MTTTRAERREKRAERRALNGETPATPTTSPAATNGHAHATNGHAHVAPGPQSAAAAFASLSSARAPGVRVAPWSPHAPRSGGNTSTATTPRAAAPSSGSTRAPTAFAAPPPSILNGTNGHQERVRAHEARQFSRAGAPMPQGEVQLAHEWARVVFDRQWDPRGCTIWLLAQGAEPYEFWIPGSSVVATPTDGEQPARALYDAVMRMRRLDDRAEHFVGRIECPSTDGRMLTLGGGLISIPPKPAPAPQPQWTQPQNGMPPNPYAPPPPYGYPPGYGAPPMPWGAGGGGWNPMMMGAPGMLPYFAPPPAPPTSVANNPQQLDGWIKLQEMSAKMRLDELRFQREEREAEARRHPPPKERDDGDSLDKAFNWMEKMDRLRGTGAHEPKERPGIRILRVDGDTIVENKDGEIDAVATGILNVGKEIRTVVRGRAQAVAAKVSANGGAPPGLSTASPPGVKNGRA